MTPFSAKLSIAWWNVRCAMVHFRQAAKALYGDPWRDQAERPGLVQKAQS